MRISEITSELKEKDRIAKLLNRYFVINGDYIIDGGLVYIKGDCVIKNAKTLFDRLPVNFGRINGNFNINDMGLKTLEGCPEFISGIFRCFNNDLRTLQGGPKKVDKPMSVAFNHLTSLEGSPEEVGGVFICRGNELKNLIGAPAKVAGFQCDNNPLISLEGLPKEINGPLNLTYAKDLPLLRIVMSAGIQSIKFDAGRIAPDLADVLMKYVGKGRAGVIQCSAEITKIGYKDNARL